MDKRERRVVVFSGTRFENLLNKENFLTRSDTASMESSKKIFEKSFNAEDIQAYLINRLKKPNQ